MMCFSKMKVKTMKEQKTEDSIQERDKESFWMLWRAVIEVNKEQAGGIKQTRLPKTKRNWYIIECLSTLKNISSIKKFRREWKYSINSRNKKRLYNNGYIIIVYYVAQKWIIFGSLKWNQQNVVLQIVILSKNSMVCKICPRLSVRIPWEIVKNVSSVVLRVLPQFWGSWIRNSKNEVLPSALNQAVQLSLVYSNTWKTLFLLN